MTHGQNRPHGFECTLCRETERLVPFEQRLGLDGDACELWLCRNCTIILNATYLRGAQPQEGDKARAGYLQQQSAGSDNFYTIDPDYLAGVPQEIDACGFPAFLLEQYPQCPRGVALDFGAGRGILAGALAKHFDKVHAAELSLNVLVQVHAVMPLRRKIKLTV